MKKLPLGCTPVSGNTPGVSHPSPAKAKHFIYLSVAQSAPVMREYRKVRRECEDRLTAIVTHRQALAARLHATINPSEGQAIRASNLATASASRPVLSRTRRSSSPSA